MVEEVSPVLNVAAAIIGRCTPNMDVLPNMFVCFTNLMALCQANIKLLA